MLQCTRPKTAISLHSQSLDGSTGLPNKIAMSGDNPFARIDPKFNQVVPWSLHTFPENFMQIGPAVFTSALA